MPSANGLKSHVSTEKAVTTQENVIKKNFGNMFAISFDFDIFKHLVNPYGFKGDLILRSEFFRKGHFV